MFAASFATARHRASALRRPDTERALAIAAAILETILGVGAVGVGLALMLGPHGEVLPLPMSLLKLAFR